MKTIKNPLIKKTKLFLTVAFYIFSNQMLGQGQNPENALSSKVKELSNLIMSFVTPIAILLIVVGLIVIIITVLSSGDNENDRERTNAKIKNYIYKLVAVAIIWTILFSVDYIVPILLK